MLAGLAFAFKAAKTAYSLFKQLKKDEEKFFSDENVAKLRLRLEAFAERLSVNQDVGWRKFLVIDDPKKWIPFARKLLKSSKLDAIENGSLFEQQKAKSAFHGI